MIKVILIGMNFYNNKVQIVNKGDPKDYYVLVLMCLFEIRKKIEQNCVYTSEQQ